MVTTSGTAIRISDGTLSRGPYLTTALGQAVIANWTETVAGTYTLTATATGLTSAASNSFSDRARRRHAQLCEPAVGKATAGNDIGPVTVRIADRYGNGLSGVAVTIGITPGTLTGGAQTLTTDATGEAVFDPADRKPGRDLQSRGHGGGTRQPQVRHLHRLRRPRRPR